MTNTYRSFDYERYQKGYSYDDPHREVEPLEQEIAVVDEALAALREAGILPDIEYGRERMLAMRMAVRQRFEIPWTAITPRMQRLIYAVNAIKRPQVMVAVGVFCGNTFISNGGAAIGPGACYAAKRLVGIELREAEADRARRNVATMDEAGIAEIVATDGVAFLRQFKEPVDLLYLDPDGTDENGEGLYLPMLKACYGRMKPGSLVLAHNSVNWAGPLDGFLKFVRDPKHMAAAVNIEFDNEGLQVAVR